MSRTTESIEWMRPFHDAAGGRTADVVALARKALPKAPKAVHGFVDDEGLRTLAHALHRSFGIRTSREDVTLPLFVATEDEEGIVVHRPRYLVRVEEIAEQVRQWSMRRDQADRELTLAQRLAPPKPAPDTRPQWPLRPSEALRLGRLTYPNPLREAFWWDAGHAACAMGAIITGFGNDGSAAHDTLDTFDIACPVCRSGPSSGYAKVMHLNDDHHWSDDQIVAWLEGLGL